MTSVREFVSNSRIAPDFLFTGAEAANTLSEIGTALADGLDLVLLIGQSGVGKTTLLSEIERRQQTLVPVVRLQFADLPLGGLLQVICARLGAPAPVADTEIEVLSATLRRRLRALDTRPLIIIDDAHAMRDGVLAALMDLLRDQRQGGRLLAQLVVAATPMAALPMARQLSEMAVLRSWSLHPLPAAEARDFVNRWFRATGFAETALTPAALDRIVLYGQGLPKRLNAICVHVAHDATRRGLKGITAALVEEVHEHAGIAADRRHLSEKREIIDAAFRHLKPNAGPEVEVEASPRVARLSDRVAAKLAKTGSASTKAEGAGAEADDAASYVPPAATATPHTVTEDVVIPPRAAERPTRSDRREKPSPVRAQRPRQRRKAQRPWLALLVGAILGLMLMMGVEQLRAPARFTQSGPQGAILPDRLLQTPVLDSLWPRDLARVIGGNGQPEGPAAQGLPRDISIDPAQAIRPRAKPSTATETEKETVEAVGASSLRAGAPVVTAKVQANSPTLAPTAKPESSAGVDRRPETGTEAKPNNQVAAEPFLPVPRPDRTPLMRAAARGDIRAVELALRDRGVVNARDPDGRSALHYGVQSGNPAVVGKLLAEGAMVDMPDLAGQTPLMRAALRGDAEIAAMLRKAGADIKRRDQKGQSAAQIAARAGHKALAKQLAR